VGHELEGLSFKELAAEMGGLAASEILISSGS
jgi:hypothetical protein